MNDNSNKSAVSGDVSSLFSLYGKVALITGAGGHLGRQMALALSDAGAHVILNGRSLEPLHTLEIEIKERGQSAECAVGDAQSPAMAASVARLLEEHGALDVLINNSYSGTAGDMKSTGNEYIEAYSSVVVASANMTRNLAPFLEASGSASVINIASMYGLVSPDPSIYAAGDCNPPFYGAAKAALIQWTRYAAVHLAANNIRVNAISPGPFPHPSLIEHNPKFIDNLSSKTPLKRVGSASEIQGPVLFLATKASSYVTGANIIVDGGWTAW